MIRSITLPVFNKIIFSKTTLCTYLRKESQAICYAVMLSVVMLSAIMLSVVMLSAIILSVVMLSVIMLSVVMMGVVMLSVAMLIVAAPLLGSCLRVCGKGDLASWFNQIQ